MASTIQPDLNQAIDDDYGTSDSVGYRHNPDMTARRIYSPVLGRYVSPDKSPDHDYYYTDSDGSTRRERLTVERRVGRNDSSDLGPLVAKSRPNSAAKRSHPGDRALPKSDGRTDQMNYSDIPAGYRKEWVDVTTASGDIGHIQHLKSLPRLEIFDESTPSKPDNYRISPASIIPDWEGAMEWVGQSSNESQSRSPNAATEKSNSLPDLSDAVIEYAVIENGLEEVEEVLADWSGRGAHVDFQNNEEVPLVQGRFLGHGSMGSVFETTVRGYRFAWKRRFCRRKIGEAERKEIEILKKVSHHHIIRLAGSYTHRQFLGLLLYPVATCDLATLLEDSEAILTNSTWDTAREQRLIALGLLYKTPEKTEFYGDRLLLSRMGCIISAVEYLHGQSIRHKDLKPSNILLSAENLWLTDFGTATDFSNQTVSTTDNCERGTPKYFAPEMAAFEKCGRSADIFSLGCVLLEMHAIQQGQGLEVLRDLRPKHDKSFQGNLDQIHEWLSRPAEWDILCDHQIKDQIRRMLARDPAKRPAIGQVQTMFALIDTFQEHSGNAPLFRECCKSLFVSRQVVEDKLERLQTELTEHLKGEYQQELEQLRKEKEEAQRRAVELQQKIDQQMWSLNAWVQRDALRLNGEAHLDNIHLRTTSAASPLPSSAKSEGRRKWNV